jgi:hypothetical protein
MNKTLIACIAVLSLTSCGQAGAVRSVDANALINVLPSPETRLADINLAAIERIASKGRVQDREYNQSQVVDQLLAHGKASIPYLISKLEDETKLEGHVKDYWSDVRVGDVAFIILTDFFTDASWKGTTIPGVGWNEFLGGGDDMSLTGEQRLRNYIALRGRKSIKERWLQIWEKHRENIIWDDEERRFVSKTSN